MDLKEQTEARSYESQSSDPLVREVFSGKIPLEQALQRLRMRLLDLSPRNRLLNYRHPKGRSIQFVDAPNLNLVFERLIENNRNLVIKYVPEPDPKSYQGKRPEVRQHAETLGIQTPVDFDPSCCGPTEHRHTPKLQALFYPAELDRLCRRIASEARTVIEETGTNMLYLMFGFLEFYERDDSERILLAPLLAVPVTLEREGIDSDSRTYIYSIAYSGEDITENLTLREKLRQDFTLNLPEFEEDDTPGIYLEKIRHSTKNRRRWAVRCQLSLGFLSFGKLAIWDDLDPKKWPNLLDHSLLKEIFSGGNVSSASLIAEDYNIDTHKLCDLPLIFDADSSQHSAIIDVLSGKNMVIIGPPGTGKSQTITNIIATALHKGKTVLFVSEKLAALEVVRRRLNMAGLGCFCLELHSHKTQKKKLLADIQERMDQTFPLPRQFKNKLETLSQQRKQLNKYVDLLGSRIGNELGLNVHEIIWAAENRRREVGDLANVTRSPLHKAKHWSLNDIIVYRRRLEDIGQLYQTIGAFDAAHPWWGFEPKPLAPGDELEIGKIAGEARGLADELFLTIDKYRDFTGDSAPTDLQKVQELTRIVTEIPDPSDNVNGELLRRLFLPGGQQDRESWKIIDYVSRQVEEARGLLDSANSVLLPKCELTPEHAEPVIKRCELNLTPVVLETSLSDLRRRVEKLEQALAIFKTSLAGVSALPSSIDQSTIEDLDRRLAEVVSLPLDCSSIGELRTYSQRVQQEVDRLGAAIDSIKGICLRWNLPFDDSPKAVIALTRQEGIEDLLPNTHILEETIAAAREASKFLFADKPLSEIESRRSEFQRTIDNLRNAYIELKSFAAEIGFDFDGSLAAVAGLVVLARVAVLAPKDLLHYRQPALGQLRILGLLDNAEQDLKKEGILRREIEEHFYLDPLPEISEIKQAIQIFRRGDRFFNFLNRDWRSAIKLFNGLAKNKRKYRASEYNEFLTKLVTWVEHRSEFLSKADYHEAFGILFEGLSTDFEKIRRLHSWYLASQAELVRIPGLVERLDLSSISTTTLYKLGARAKRIYELADIMHGSHDAVARALKLPKDPLVEEKCEVISSYLDKLQRVANGLQNIYRFFSRFVKTTVSPKRGTELFHAKLELKKAQPHLEILSHGFETIQKACGQPLAWIASLPCITWTEYLQNVRGCLNRLISLCDYLGNIVGENVSPGAGRTFISAKLNLDAAISELATIPSFDPSKGWNEMAIFAHSALDVSTGLVNLLEPAVFPNKSAREAIAGIKAKKEALSILAELQANCDVNKVLQNFFTGIHTNLEVLHETYKWGETIVGNIGFLSDPLRNKLLSVEGPKNLLTARQLLTSASRKFTEIQDILNRLGIYGSFNWDKWEEAVQRDKKFDYAEGVKKRLDLSCSHVNDVLSWSRYLSERAECRSHGLADFTAALEQKKLPPLALGKVFEFVVYWSIGRGIYLDFPILANFRRISHERMKVEFSTLDREVIKLNGKMLAYEIDKNKKVPEGTTGIKASERTEMPLLYHELTKQRRHLPIRQLIKRAGHAIQALKPCFMMGPLSVAQYLEQDAVRFDLVVMDEASQLRPEEALGAIVRGNQVVVVGDQKQLPPTSFFERLLEGQDDGEEEEESPAALSGTESILDICHQLFHPVRNLKWHYRSQHESLIAFSNHQFYNGKLIVFPSPFERSPRLGLRYRYIRNGIYRDRQNFPEAQQVVDAILEHTLRRPEESLGVVTLNQTQRDLIEELFDKKLRDSQESQAFLSRWENEGWPFFVKNLESVQGDERDVIFISTTFGKAPETTKVRQNFGPISRPAGWRRLNVLFTRARKRIELFTSMFPEDVIVDETTPAGTKALREYLDYAKTGVLSSIELGQREPESDFEIAVGNMLKVRGYDIVPQLGVTGFFIDIAVRNPDRPGEFLAGVECDGASYHSSGSARDRDRIRQEILEALGWKGRIFRIWSTDWFYEPNREIERLLSFLEERQRVSRSEPISEYDEFFEKEIETKIQESANESILHETEAYGIDLFVEVGDQVTYCFVDRPEEKRTIQIVEGESKPLLHIVSERAPVAQALLGLVLGEEGVFETPNGKTTIRVLKIQRQEEE